MCSHYQAEFYPNIEDIDVSSSSSSGVRVCSPCMCVGFLQVLWLGFLPIGMNVSVCSPNVSWYRPPPDSSLAKAVEADDDFCPNPFIQTHKQMSCVLLDVVSHYSWLPGIVTEYLGNFCTSAKCMPTASSVFQVPH